MGHMGVVGDRRGSFAGSAWRITAARYAPAGAAALLAFFAVAESIERVAFDPGSIGWHSPSGSALHDTGPTILALWLIALLTTLPLAIPRPVPAAVAVTAACALSLATFNMLTIAGLCAELAVLYRLGRSWTSTGPILLAIALGMPFLVLGLVGTAGSEARILSVLLAALAPSAALAGIGRRARRDALAHSVAEEVMVGSLLQHAARGERARIARELHDVVAHHVSMVAVQAETARLTTPGMPAAGAQRLLDIGDTARTALTEMRRLLGVLREDTDGAAPVAADRKPQPGLRQLNELLDQAWDASGTGIRLIVSGTPATLDPGVEMAAYRIVQEALTNSRRHAPGAAVDVELHYTDDVLRVRVRDNGPGPSVGTAVGGAGTGYGLLGMRERAVAVGGSLRTGMAASGGFVVEALLPAKLEAG